MYNFENEISTKLTTEPNITYINKMHGTATSRYSSKYWCMLIYNLYNISTTNIQYNLLNMIVNVKFHCISISSYNCIKTKFVYKN